MFLAAALLSGCSGSDATVTSGSDGGTQPIPAAAAEVPAPQFGVVTYEDAPYVCQWLADIYNKHDVDMFDSSNLTPSSFEWQLPIPRGRMTSYETERASEWGPRCKRELGKLAGKPVRTPEPTPTKRVEPVRDENGETYADRERRRRAEAKAKATAEAVSPPSTSGGFGSGEAPTSCLRAHVGEFDADQDDPVEFLAELHALCAVDAALNGVTYEVSGTARSALVTYGDGGMGISQEVVGLPWSKSAYAPGDHAVYNVTAQNQGGSGTITCTIRQGGVAVSSNSSSGPYAVVACAS